MLRKYTLSIIAVFSTLLLFGQECPTINENGSFEDMIFVPGGEAAIGISTGQISNWYASHGTVDYLTSDWNWYDVEGITSVGAHMCYGNRDSHDHSEGMFTTAKIYGDDDLLYTLSMDYGTICDSENNGYLNIALNNNLEAGAHNYFQYPTAEVFPEVYQDIQPVDRLELEDQANIETSGMTSYEFSFVPSGDYDQIWMFTEYQHEQEEFLNCGIVIDNVKLTATTSALSGIDVTQVVGDNYQVVPSFDVDIDVVTYSWMVNDEFVGSEEELIYNFTEGLYTICLDIVDSRKACGSICYELDLTATPENEDNMDRCTYSACLDGGGFPNLVAVEFLTASGDIVIIDENTEGFFFPYCDGTPSMCNGGENEVDLFIDDLNSYFYNNGIDAEATAGDGTNLFDDVCRSFAITIESSEILPKAILIDDFSTDEVMISIASFIFDPSSCGSSITEEDEAMTQYNVIADNEIDIEVSTTEFAFNPIFRNGQVAIHVDDSDVVEKGALNDEVLISEVGIYTLSGDLILSINDYQIGEEINVNSLPTGMYVVNVVNKQEQNANYFFKGE